MNNLGIHNEGVPRASYRSERRKAQAAATRQAILDAARALFGERGYARTTVADIAAAAPLAIPTVYVSVGPKPTILGELRKQIPVLAGVSGDIKAIQAALAPASDPVRMIAGSAAGLRRMMETSGDLMFAIEAAVPYEPVAAEAWEEGMVIHSAAMGMTVQRLEALGALKQTSDAAKAADMLAFLSLPATWRTLGQLYGWTYDQIEVWMVETALTLVTEPSPAPRTNAAARVTDLPSVAS
jgi:AcrR family transcriptional regulator